MSENLIPLEQNPRDVIEIVLNYDKLIKDTQKDLEDFKNEQLKLKEEVAKILADNRKDICNCHIIENSRTENENSTRENQAITDEVITNLKYQIDHFKQERDTVHSLWKISQDTIVNLEAEIQNYRNQLFKPDLISEIKQKYSSTINVLEQTIRSQRTQLAKQIEINKNILISQHECETKVKKLEENLLDKEKEIVARSCLGDTNTDLKKHLDSVMRVNNDLENSLKLAKKVIDERFSRESCALEKINEALHIAENAIAEKEEAIRRESLIKDECQHLASTVGEVMDEAASKVERNIEKLKKRHEEKIGEMVKKQMQIEALLENQIKATKLAEIRSSKFECKLKEVIQENITLDFDLQTASQAIIELELKLEAIESLLDKDKSNKKLSEEKEKEIEHYLYSNKQIKERWKTAVDEVTKKFETELQRLRSENTKLKTENQELRLK